MLEKMRMIGGTILLKVLFRGKIELKGVLNFSRKTKVTIHSGGKIVLGKRVATSNFVDLAAVAGGTLVLGSRVGINTNCIFTAREKIMIGDNCIFGPNVMIFDHDHLFDTEGVDHLHYSTGPIIIGQNCWVGSGAIILKDTEIGEGCIIGAGTIVKGKIPGHSIVTSDRNMIIKTIEKR